MQVYLIVALVFSLLVAVFAIQNTEIVVIKFLTFQSSVSLVLVILGSAAVGALALFFLNLFRQVGSWMTVRQLRHQKEELEKKVKLLEERLNPPEQPAPAECKKEEEPQVLNQ